MLPIVLFLVVTAPGQVIDEPGLLAGPWECATCSDHIGLHLYISTSRFGTEMQIRVDRIAGADWGWYVVDGQTATWDGTRLTIRHEQTDIDLVFDRAKQEWAGSFATRGRANSVRLRRPAPGIATTSGAVGGTWKADGPPRGPNGCVHFATLRSGVGVAWLDRSFDGGRYGEELTRPEFASGTVRFRLAPFINGSYLFEGKFSDGKRLDGAWTLGLQAPDRFVAAPGDACFTLPVTE